jgi:hypothetical protein
VRGKGKIEKSLEFSLVKYYYVTSHERFTDLFETGRAINVTNRQVLKGMQARAGGLYAGMDDASGGQIFAGVPGDPGKAHVPRDVQDA